MIKEAASQTALGQARLVFWRDAINDIFAVSHASGALVFYQCSFSTGPRVILLRLDSMKRHRGVAWRRTTFSGSSKPGSVCAPDLILILRTDVVCRLKSCTVNHI